MGNPLVFTSLAHLYAGTDANGFGGGWRLSWRFDLGPDFGFAVIVGPGSWGMEFELSGPIGNGPGRSMVELLVLAVSWLFARGMARSLKTRCAYRRDLPSW